MASPDLECSKKVLGSRSISTATPEEMKKIQKCSIIASGGKPNPKVFGKKKGYKQINNPVTEGGKRELKKKL